MAKVEDDYSNGTDAVMMKNFNISNRLRQDMKIVLRAQEDISENSSSSTGLPRLPTGTPADLNYKSFGKTK